jgi:hypothetical protein
MGTGYEGDGSWFGSSVAIDGDTLIIGAGYMGDAGQAYVFTRNAEGVWSEQQILEPPNLPDPDAYGFGLHVAIDGDTVAVTEPYHDDGGRVHVFTRSAGVWSLQQTFAGTDTVSGDAFGGMDLYGKPAAALEGDVLVVGAPAADGAVSGSGVAYVFTRSGSTWTQQQKISTTDVEADAFGLSVAIQDGTIVIGAAESETSPEMGAAYIFTRSGSTWSQLQKLSPSPGHGSDVQFGVSVDIKGDMVVIGAQTEEGDYGGDEGVVYVYRIDADTELWSLVARVSAFAEELGGIPGLFGGCVFIVDERMVVVSARRANNDFRDNEFRGYVYVLGGDSDGRWSALYRLCPEEVFTHETDGFQFGFSVAMSGSTIIGGAPYKVVTPAYSYIGAAYLFEEVLTTEEEEDSYLPIYPMIAQAIRQKDESG